MQRTLDFNGFFEAYKSSVLNKEVDKLLDLYDEDLIAFDMWDRWSYAGGDSWREMNQQWLGSLGSEFGCRRIRRYQYSLWRQDGRRVCDSDL